MEDEQEEEVLRAVVEDEAPSRPSRRSPAKAGKKSGGMAVGLLVAVLAVAYLGALTVVFLGYADPWLVGEVKLHQKPAAPSIKGKGDEEEGNGGEETRKTKTEKTQKKTEKQTGPDDEEEQAQRLPNQERPVRFIVSRSPNLWRRQDHFIVHANRV
jgi:hypothetical protein